MIISTKLQNKQQIFQNIYYLYLKMRIPPFAAILTNLLIINFSKHLNEEITLRNNKQTP